MTGSTSEHLEQWCRWLTQVWARDSIAEAIEVASPVLARRVRDVCDGRIQDARQVRRVVVSVARYVLRITGRATPFGLFAGVAPVRFGTGLAVRWGEDHHAVARTDAEWLADVVTRLETCRELLLRLPVMANNLGFVRDGRLVVPGQRRSAQTGRGVPAEVSVRHTRAVETVIQGAQRPVQIGTLVGKLAAEFPRTPQAVAEEMLVRLVAYRVLLSSLSPPMTVTDALGHVLHQLAAVRAETVAEVASTVRDLGKVRDELCRHNHELRREYRRETRRSVVQQMAAISSTVEPALTVDLRLDCHLALPERVAREAEAAASALARLTPHPFGLPAWQDYHARFLERYGTGAAVPVVAVVNADTGLGFPAGYWGSLQEPPTPRLSTRDTRLLALAQRAALDGGVEVVLDDRAIADLTLSEPSAGDRVEAGVSPHTELCCEVHAPTRDAFDRGEFTLVVVGASRAAGTMTGRFLGLLEAADRQHWEKAHAGLPTVDTEALSAQVSCPPLYPRTENVARVPDVLPRLVSLAEHHTGSGLVPLDDLAVCADTWRMYLVSLAQRQPVELVMLHAVELRNHTYPLVRFLTEITTARSAACAPFSWGAASALPFLPRIRYGRTVLAPARWNLAASDLRGKNTPLPEWLGSLADWRRQVRLPQTVYLGGDDRRMRLNMDESLHLAMLRSHLDRTGHANLHEAPDSSAYGWLDGRAHQIVMPMAVTSVTFRPSATRRAATARVVGWDDGRLPGSSTWLYAKIYGHPDRQSDILTAHLPGLLSAWDSFAGVVVPALPRPSSAPTSAGTATVRRRLRRCCSASWSLGG